MQRRFNGREKVLPFLEALATIDILRTTPALKGALVGDKPMNLQLASAMVLATDVVKVFNPQSPPARGKTAGQLLVSDSGATVLGYFFLDFRAPKKCNETATKGEFNEMKSRIGTRNHLVAATCAQSAAGRREGKTKM